MIPTCRSLFLQSALAWLCLAPAWAEPTPTDLGAYLDRVLRYNEQLQVQAMDYEISRQVVVGARAAFEPELVVRGQYDDTLRPNNAEELRNLGGLPFFKQRQMLYSAAVETLTATGARTRVGLDVRHINNNLQPFRALDREWSSFLGLSFVQPLLKGAGRNVNLAALRVAALESDQAFQEYRRQTMVILIGAEIAYWNLFYAQEQQRFYEESLRTVGVLANDIAEQYAAGRATKLDALNAEVALKDREARLSVAQQALQESLNTAKGFTGEESAPVRATAPPVAATLAMDVESCFEAALRSNPEYLVRERQIAIEGLRMAVAENQRRPSLDLSGSLGFAGLSETFGDAMSDVGNARHPTWSLGVELRIPLGGGTKGKSDLETARLRRAQAIRQLGALRSQMRAAVENAIFKVRSGHANVASFSESRKLTETLLDTELEKVDAGTSSPGKVLEAEQAVFEARNVELENRLALQRALLELDVVMGVVLEKRGIDASQSQMAQKTAAMVEVNKIPPAQLETYRQAVEPIIAENP